MAGGKEGVLTRLDEEEVSGLEVGVYHALRVDEVHCLQHALPDHLQRPRHAPCRPHPTASITLMRAGVNANSFTPAWYLPATSRDTPD